MNPVVIVLVVLVGVGLYLIATYNRFASMRVQIEASIQEIGNQLKRQADLIPNLENSVKGYLKHEKGIFESLTAARKAVESAVESKKASLIEAASEKINAVLPKLQVLVESNPEMKGVEVVNKLMNELRDTADKLVYARRTVIDLTQDFNQMLVVFPTSVIGSIFGMKKEKGLATPLSGEHLEVSDEETKSPKIQI
jgi:LemA protein